MNNQNELLQRLKSEIWRIAFKSAALPGGKWKSQQCKQMASQIFSQAGELLSAQAIAKFSDGGNIGERELNVLAKYALLHHARQKVHQLSANRPSRRR